MTIGKILPYLLNNQHPVFEGFDGVRRQVTDWNTPWPPITHIDYDWPKRGREVPYRHISLLAFARLAKRFVGTGDLAMYGEDKKCRKP